MQLIDTSGPLTADQPARSRCKGCGSMVPGCGQQRPLCPGRPAPLRNPQSNKGQCTTLNVNSRWAVHPICSLQATAIDYTATAAHSLRQGNGLARRILSDPNLEGDPLAFLKATEAYWKVKQQQAAGQAALLHCNQQQQQMQCIPLTSVYYRP